MAKVWFVGAGPGDPELITLKAQKLIAQADAILYAGSLVSKTATQWAKPECAIEDSKGMTLEEITAWLIKYSIADAIVIRLQTGDPGLYGALVEMIQPLDQAGIDIGVVPGVTSAMASAAAAVETLTLPEVTQTVIFSRVAGRTPMPEGESLVELGQHHCTLCLYLSITLLKKVREDLLAAGWSDDAPIVVVHKASWPGEEQVLRGTLATIKEQCKQAGVNAQAMIIASPALGARQWTDIKKSKLYAADFSHRFRKAIKTQE
ncbi:MAG: precorrin-4 C(11)-methyltransferase [Methyloprofundus sp.]|nr:precorrin-4 C(11)-methyltransferase [Methyloprofundus sp.]